MRKDYVRLVRLLALSGWTEKQIFEAVREIHFSSPTMVMDDIRVARFDLGAELRHPRTPRSDSHDDPLLDRAYETLMDNPGVTAQLAAKELRRVILEENSETSIRPMRAKEGLRKWLEYVAQQAGPSKLLHFANKARNRLSHDALGPWSLRDDGS